MARVRFPAGAKDFSLLHDIWATSGAHPVPYPMGSGGSIQTAKQLGVKLTTNLYLVPKSRMVELYLHSAIRLNGVVLN
jgi:hypothetical protein